MKLVVHGECDIVIARAICYADGGTVVHAGFVSVGWDAGVECCEIGVSFLFTNFWFGMGESIRFSKSNQASSTSGLGLPCTRS